MTSATTHEPNFDVIWPGSMPIEMSPEAAQRLLLTEVGSFLRRSVPPQEPPDWIVPHLMGLRDHPDLDVARPGQWRNYDDQIHYRIKRGHTFREELINVGIVDSVKNNLPLFLKLRRELNLPADIEYEISTKGVFDFAFFAFGAMGILQQPKYLVPFLDATAREMGTAYEYAATRGVPVLFQLEMPAETVFACKVGPLRRLFVGWLARNVTKLAAYVPHGARCGVHLCYGDLGHKSLVQPRTLAPVVALANSIVENWPSNTPLDYVHIPMAAGDITPPVKRDYYLPLRGLRLPPACQLAAGFLHENLSASEADQIAEWVSDYFAVARLAVAKKDMELPPVFPRIALAPSCGCGRRTQEQTITILDQAARLCATGDTVADAGAQAQTQTD